ncbi:MAG: sugar-transfer associated ATP-grasp domain-containing protein [Candidatus Xenobia bacterium]
MRLLRKQILTTAAAATVWEAWTRPERIEEWLTDHASGQWSPGSHITLRWEQFSICMDFEVVEVVPQRLLALQFRLPGNFSGRLTICLTPRPTGSLVELVEESPRLPAPDPGFAEAEWELSLAAMKVYVEKYFGRPRNSFLAILPTRCDPARLTSFFRSAAGLDCWLSQESTLGRPGQDYRLRLADGSVASGQVLAHSRRGLALEWSEVGGCLQFNCLLLPPGFHAFCVRGSGWNLEPARAAEIERMLEDAVSRLSDRLDRPSAWTVLSAMKARTQKAVSYLTTLHQVAREERLHPLGLLLEHGLLYLLRGVDSQAYFTYRLFDPGLPLAEKFTYLDSDDSPRREAMTGVHTPPWLAALYNDKVAFKFIFGTDLPVAPIRAVVSGSQEYLEQLQHLRQQARKLLIQRGRDQSYLEPMECLRNEADLERWMQNTDLTEFALKPVFGMRGFRTRIFVGRAPDHPAAFVTLRGEIYDARRLAAFCRGTAFLIEERIHMHPVLEDILGSTLCCARVVTTVSLEGEASILGAVFKLQPRSVGVDHLAYGAIGAWIDLETGRLGPGRTRLNRAWVSCLPGTGLCFTGFQLPCWQQVKELALRAAAAQPQAHSIGWDIAISPQGPVLIEGNPNWSAELIQMAAPYGLMQGQFRRMCQTLTRRCQQSRSSNSAPAATPSERD